MIWILIRVRGKLYTSVGWGLNIKFQNSPVIIIIIIIIFIFKLYSHVFFLIKMPWAWPLSEILYVLRGSFESRNTTSHNSRTSPPLTSLPVWLHLRHANFSHKHTGVHFHRCHPGRGPCGVCGAGGMRSPCFKEFGIKGQDNCDRFPTVTLGSGLFDLL